jgi:small nuclear ribonucleoprotein (snRNP)-like protein
MATNHILVQGVLCGFDALTNMVLDKAIEIMQGNFYRLNILIVFVQIIQKEN